jgi:limonene-1,2-epoxide hydrolase
MASETAAAKTSESFDGDAIVTSFMDALERRDLDAMLAQMAPDIVYHNVPLDPLDKDGARRFLGELFENLKDYRIEVLGQAATGSVVFNERMEYFVFEGAGGKSVDIPVAGVFEIDNQGLISAWRDYFDLSTWTSQGGPALS